MGEVVVVGSGAAGLTAAVAAAEAGAEVTVVEKADVLGGTTALSGAVAWMPANRFMADAGVDDSPELARDYLRQLRLGDVDDHLLDVFVTEAAATADWVEAVSGLRWHSIPYPDYHAERPGGASGHRSIEPEPFVARAGTPERVRVAPNVVAPVTYLELTTDLPTREEIRERVAGGVLTMGRAYVAAMLEAAEDRGATVRVGEAARAVRWSDGAVAGVETGGGPIDGRVVLASGGFDRDPGTVRTFLRGPMEAPVGAPGPDGFALRTALAGGAELANMAEAWWCPALSIPDEAIDDEPFHRLVLTERARPGSLMVDSTGRRFTNEAQNYNDVGRAMHRFDATTFSYPAAQSWLVFDGAYRRRYHVGPLRRDDPDPDWLRRGESVGDLALTIGLDPATLTETVERFNVHARDGRDPDHGRGDHRYDRFVGDPKRGHPTLGPLFEPPFYAIPIVPGCLGTKGGPRTDAQGRVRSTDGGVIGGLFAVGNAAASPLGLAYPGAGGTIGPMLVFGRAAGRAAAAIA